MTFKKTNKFLAGSEIFYRYGSKILTKFLYNLKLSGMENIPEKGGVLLICNHISYVDGLIIHTACKRPVNFIIDTDIYNIPVVKYFMDLNGAIPIHPDRKSVRKAIEKVKEKLDDGEIVCIFPEGSLTFTGNMSRFKFGIEWMISNSPDAVIIPMALKGLWGSIFSRKYRRSKFKFLPRNFRRRVDLIAGKPILRSKAKINHLQQIVMELKNSL